MKKYLAIDIGASSGRHIVGWKENGVLKTQEVYRFLNSVETMEGHLCWNMEKLVLEVSGDCFYCPTVSAIQAKPDLKSRE